MREVIEPVTGANLAELGVPELEGNLKFWENRQELKAPEIVAALKVELEWRKTIQAIKCHWLTEAGVCRSVKVAAKHGQNHACPKLSSKPCTLKKIELFAKF